MTCDWVPKLDLYVDGELSGGELKEVEAHLQACPTCAADALNRLQLKRMTESAGRRYSPRPEFRLKVAQSIDAAEASTVGVEMGTSSGSGGRARVDADSRRHLAAKLA